MKEQVIAPRTIYYANAYRNKEDYDNNIFFYSSVSSNVVTHEGMDSINNVFFYGNSPFYWYFAPFKTNTSCVNTMTYATPVYTETTEYDETVRQRWNPGVSASQVIGNLSSKALITINAAAAISLYGCGLVGGAGASVKGNTGTSGCVLYSATLFSPKLDVVAGNIVALGLTITQS